MSKKLIITLSIIFSIIAVILILFWTLFALSSVSVNFKSTTKNLNVTSEEVVEAGEFRKGACVFFESKKSSIKKINNYVSQNKDFAYLRVVNIETVFPNKFVVHIAEREELFAVEHNGQVLICDREFRVLDILTEEFVSTTENAILLNGLIIENNEISVGNFLQIKQKSMQKFYANMLQCNRDYAQQIGKFQEINLGTYIDATTNNEYISMELLTFQGRKFVINNIDFAFANKVQKMFAVESSLFNQNVDQNGNFLNSAGDIVYVVKTSDNEYVGYESVKDMQDENGDLLYPESDKIALSYQLVQNCFVKIDNLSLSNYVNRTENDIYYSFVSL